MLAHADAHLVADFFYRIDRQCRNDLSKKLLISERDYVSRFATFAMYPFGPFVNSNNFSITSTLPQPIEKKFGCDGLIIFKNGTHVKIGMFEAKWVRMNPSSTTRWDNKYSKSTKSRFTLELEKQQKIPKEVAVWEMFFNDLPVGTLKRGYHKEVSACVWHDLAFYYMQQRVGNDVWSNKKNRHLNTLLRYRDMLKSDNNIYDIILNILSCKKGILISTGENDTQITLKTPKGEKLKIPIPSYQQKNTDSIEEFMQETGFSHYSFFDLSDLSFISKSNI